MLEVQAQVARGVDQDQKTYPRREQSVDGGVPIERDGEAKVPRRRPRDVHAPSTPVPREDGRKEGKRR